MAVASSSLYDAVYESRHSGGSQLRRTTKIEPTATATGSMSHVPKLRISNPLNSTSTLAGVSVANWGLPRQTVLSIDSAGLRPASGAPPWRCRRVWTGQPYAEIACPRAFSGVVNAQAFAVLRDVLDRDRETREATVASVMRTGHSFGWVVGPCLAV